MPRFRWIQKWYVEWHSATAKGGNEFTTLTDGERPFSAGNAIAKFEREHKGCSVVQIIPRGYETESIPK